VPALPAWLTVEPALLGLDGGGSCPWGASAPQALETNETATHPASVLLFT
jgi:hypothetical protein